MSWPGVKKTVRGFLSGPAGDHWVGLAVGRLVAVLAVVAVVVGGGAWLLRAGCNLVYDLAPRRALSVSTSPAGRWRAVANEYSTGGATQGFAYEVRLKAARDSLSRGLGRQIWRSYKVRPKELRWRSSDTLEVVIARTGKNVEYRWSIGEKSRRNPTVVTVMVPPSSADTLAGDAIP